MDTDNKHYFFDMLAVVQTKLNALDANSTIRKYFPDSRLDQISKKIANSSLKDLELGYWQPFFLFLAEASNPAIKSFEDDLTIVASSTRRRHLSERMGFLRNEEKSAHPWAAGLFEIYTKAALLRSGIVDSLDYRQANKREADAMAKVNQRVFCLEFTTRGESNEGKNRWQDQCEAAKKSSNRVFVESQDAYSPGRLLYETVYNKITHDFDPDMSQLSPDFPNLLLIGLFPMGSNLTSTSPSIKWALDELFSLQPTGNISEISLDSYLNHQQKKPINENDDLRIALLKAPSQISGVLLFDGCKLGSARINYNASDKFRISHDEMSFFEKLYSQPPLYGR